MPTSGTLITKSSVVSQINTTIVNQKNARYVWSTAADPNPDCGEIGGAVAQSTTADLAANVITASQIVSAALIYARDSTRIRLFRSFVLQNPSCGGSLVQDNYNIAATTITEPNTIALLNSTPGPTAGTLISAAGINNYFTTLFNTAVGSESGTFLVQCGSYQACHCSCHSSCHNSCHNSCHSSCHSSRARR